MLNHSHALVAAQRAINKKEKLIELLSASVSSHSIGLARKTREMLEANEIFFVIDLVQETAQELLEFDDADRNMLDQIDAALERNKLHLGMNLPEDIVKAAYNKTSSAASMKA